MHWVDEKHEPTGTNISHIEAGDGAIASRLLLPEDFGQGAIKVTIGNNDGVHVLKEVMLELDSCRLMILDVDSGEPWLATMI